MMTEEADRNILEARGLSVGYGGRTVLGDLNLSLRRGQLTVLIGANGSGKSTLLRTITGVQPALQGEVSIDGENLSDISPARRARLISLVLTDRRGGGGLTLRELVSIGRHPYSGFFGRLSADDKAAIDGAIAAVGLEHKATSFVANLSDGERQKAMIARAIAQQTPLIVLDEPTAFLDVASRWEVMELLAGQCRRGTTVLLSSHDIAPSLETASQVWAVAEGKVFEGTPRQLTDDGTLDRVYRGVRFSPQRHDFIPAAQ